MVVLNAEAPDHRVPWLMKTTIPPMLQYPVGDAAFQFTSSLVALFYAPELSGRLRGLIQLVQCFLPSIRAKQSAS